MVIVWGDDNVIECNNYKKQGEITEDDVTAAGAKTIDGLLWLYQLYKEDSNMVDNALRYLQIARKKYRGIPLSMVICPILDKLDEKEAENNGKYST